MYKVIILVMSLVLPGFAAAAEPEPDDRELVVKQESQSVFKGLLYKVWGKLRSYNPKTVRYRNRAAVTAGIRGAETTTSLMQPYWKGDLTEDPVYQQQLKDYSGAQQLAENGDLKAAASALNSFIDKYDNSDLKANAQFALGITYGGLGDRQSSIRVLNGFVADNPDHPLVGDAREVIDELQ